MLVKLRDGVACEIEEGAWKLGAVEPTGEGGQGCAPKPGALMRAEDDDAEIR